MARNVRKKMASSATLYIFDVNREACEKFVRNVGSLGPIEVASSAKELTTRSATVISMLPMDAHARAVYLDQETGVIAASKNRDRLILECSTVNVATTRDIGHKIMDAGVGMYVDAPVSGGVKGAEDGTLSFFLGHADPVARRVRDVVGWMGADDRINVCGGLGSGLVCKIVNNYIGLTNIAVAAEGLAFGLRSGVDKHILYQCIKGSSGDSWALNFANPVPGIVPGSASSRGFKAGFTSRLCAKDINMAINAAHQVGIKPNLGEVAVKYFERADQDPRTAVSSASQLISAQAADIDDALC
jgi:3-hydroxyisobutyrate dehydrogenase